MESEKVSIIIPTRDKLESLRRSVDSVIRGSRQLNAQLIIIDNGSVEQATLEFLTQLASQGHQVIRVDEKFNYSKLINTGILASEGKIIVLMNNDVECKSKYWLSNLINPLRQIPSSGIIGMPLTYPGTGIIQHFGVVLGRHGIAGNVWRGELLTKDLVEETHSSLIPVSAVTFALAAFRRELVEEIGLLDEKFRVGLNDVDFCVRANAAGFTNFITTFSVQSHEESLSRGKKMNLKSSLTALVEITRFLAKHGFPKDPYFT